MRFRLPLRRSWLRLSIRTLLVAVALLCVWLAYATHRARLQEELVRRIYANGGGAFGYHHEMDEAGQHIPDAEPPGPLWLRRLIGDHAFLRLRYVGTYKVREEEMQLISKFPSIEELSLDESVRDEWLQHLASLRNLKTLTLESPHISDHGIKHLAGLRKLESLNLTHARVTDEGLKRLVSLRNLKELILDYTQVTADGADWVRKNLSQVKLFAAGFASVPDEREAVRQLIKSGGHFCADKDGCISEVMFFGTDVDDDDLRPLESLKRLQSLQLVNTRVTFSGVNRILQANPKLTVSPRFRQPLPEEADAVAALNRIGARLYFDPQGHVKQVDSFDEGLSEDALQPLTQLRQLKTVISFSRHIGREGCRQLAKIDSLETLSLDHSSLNDADLEQLARLSRLKSLSITGPDISDDGLAYLGRLPSLGKLRLKRAAVAGPGLSHLKNLTELLVTFESSTSFGDDGLAYLSGLTKLRKLWLHNTRISDDGLVHLETLTQLESLGLADSNITDAGLDRLKIPPKLKNLSVGTGVTAVGLQRFRSNHPACKISY